MITLEQLDELENRIIKALELIGDLRTENSRLEVENQKLRKEYEDLKITLDQKERDVRDLKQQLEKTNEELRELKEKESILEKRISEILTKLSTTEETNYQAKESFASTKKQETPPIISNGDLTIVEEDKAKSESKEENFVEIEIEEPIKKVEVKQEQEQVIKSSLDTQERISTDEEDIIVLDEDEDEIVLADEPEEIDFEDNQEEFQKEFQEAKETEKSQSLVNNEKDEILEEDLVLDDDIGVFELENDEDFLIIEENEDDRENKQS
ncbi:MAG: hypothetical protein ACK4UJ_07125 [Leptonema sp. (in: bacteria)]